MPDDFIRCINQGGRVWTEKIDATHYQHFCKKGKNVYKGHVKTKKGK